MKRCTSIVSVVCLLTFAATGRADSAPPRTAPNVDHDPDAPPPAVDDMPSSLSPRGTHDLEPSEGSMIVPAPAAPAGFRKIAISVTDAPLIVKIAKAREMRTTGMLLTGIATAALLASTVVWSIEITAPPKRESSSSIDPAFGFRVGGGVTLGIGVVFAIPGVIAWAVADRRINRWEPELKERLLKRVQEHDAATAKANGEPSPEIKGDDSVGRPPNADVHDQPQSGEAGQQRRPTVGD